MEQVRNANIEYPSFSKRTRFGIFKPFTNERFPFSLLEPVSAKTASNGIEDPFLCPTEASPYIATVKNSGGRAHKMQSLATDYLETMARMAKTGPLDCSL